MTFLAVRIERLAVVVFLLVFAGVFWPPDGYLAGAAALQQGASDAFDFAAFLLLAAFLAIAGFIRRRDMARRLIEAWPVLTLVALAFLSAFWSDDPTLAIRRSGTVALSTLFGIYLVARGELGDLIALLVKVWIIAMIASLAAIVLIPSLAIGGNETYVNAWRGAFTDKNTLGLACALTIVISGYAFYYRHGPRWLAALAVAAALVLLVLAQSKTPVVVIAVAFYAGVFALMLRRRSGAGIAASYGFGVVGILGIGLFALNWTAILAAMGRDATLTDRTLLWHYALIAIERRPWLGYGFGSFWRQSGVEANRIWALIGFPSPHAHNAWLEIGLSLGIVGIALAALNWLVAFYRVGRVVTAPGARQTGFCFALLVGFFVENLTEYEFFRARDILWLLFVVTIVHLADARVAARAARRVERSRAAPAGRDDLVAGASPNTAAQ